ncbi:acyltransferase family protein [Mucilaginibacter xinganensis]|uniref:Acyltransferase 3 domain-containing protein n=1 Tax=Mucilaginibacter xinganensis TaxID=1234841 RepID=A0A223P429_9SPHI|nr:acyltransferase [Mucilaginibacter xinganensis]ASU36714.1 hypothetical protein MuYL_4831 [Mucilaginibacter xinganensis]
MENYSFSSADRSHKLQFIDNLRALAILLVIFHHVGEAFPDADYLRIISKWGKLGVQLFFVMSAFTLCYTGSKLPLNRKAAVAFYIKRLFRIAPMYYLAIIGYYYVAKITSNIAGAKSLGDIVSYTKWNVLSNVLFLHGLYPPGNNSIVPGGWSIGCEMLFYLLFPFLMHLTRISKGYLLAIQAVFCFVLYAFLLAAKLNGHQGVGGESSFAYYFLGNQMPTFLLGIALFFFWRSNKFYNVLLFASVAGVIAIALFIYFGSSAWVWVILPPVAGVLSCLLAKLVSKIHINKIFTSIGQVSYSMYIFHFVFVWTAIELLRRSGLNWGANLSAIVTFCFVVVSSFLFSKITYKLIEVPFVKIGRNLANGIYSGKIRQREMEISGSK